MIIDVKSWRELFDDKAIQRIAETIHAEARSEGEKGMHAVAAVIGNRIQLSYAGKGYNWGKTPEEIVTFGKDGRKQFSPWNSSDPNNPDTNPPDVDTPEYQTAYDLAERLAAGTLSDPTNGAEHFHTANLARPGWATGTAQAIGKHYFYDLIPADSKITINGAEFDIETITVDKRIREAFKGTAAAPVVDENTFVPTPSVLMYDNAYPGGIQLSGLIDIPSLQMAPSDLWPSEIIIDSLESEPEEEPSFHADTEDKTAGAFKVKGSLSQTILAAAKEYGIEDFSGGKAWLLSKQVAELNDIENADRVAANKDVYIPRSLFAPA